MMDSRLRHAALVGIVGGLAAVVACGHKSPPMTQPAPPPPPAPVVAVPPPPPPPAPRVVAPPAPAPAPPTEAELFDRMSLAELNASQPLGDVFFAYDRVEITDEGRAVLQRDSEWLRRWTRTRVLIEGHADERGTSEYNLALGEKRAAAVQTYLLSLGVDAGRITTVSRGKEAPFCTTQDEDCWLQNRRGHFIVTAK